MNDPEANADMKRAIAAVLRGGSSGQVSMLHNVSKTQLHDYAKASALSPDGKTVQYPPVLMGEGSHKKGVQELSWEAEKVLTEDIVLLAEAGNNKSSLWPRGATRGCRLYNSSFFRCCRFLFRVRPEQGPDSGSCTKAQWQPGVQGIERLVQAFSCAAP